MEFDLFFVLIAFLASISINFQAVFLIKSEDAEEQVSHPKTFLISIV